MFAPAPTALDGVSIEHKTAGSAGALRRMATATAAVHRECHDLDEAGIARGWATYHAHLGAVSELLDDQTLAEFDAVVTGPARGGAGELRLAFAALSAWTAGHLAHQDVVAATDAMVDQVEQAIADAVERFDGERAAAAEPAFYGNYV